MSNSPSSNPSTRIELLGVPVDVLLPAQALAYVRTQLKVGTTPKAILAINPEKVMTLRKGSSLMPLFRRAGLLLPDGIGVVLAGRWLLGRPMVRIPGSDFMLEICAIAAQEGQAIYLYGASEDTSRKAEAFLRERFPDLRIAGRANGYLPPEDMDHLVEAINDSGAAVLFLALGSPRQEQWLMDHMDKLTVKLCQGVGGTLDTLAGHVTRAPKAFQNLGLEWFYRLCADPRRLARQRVIPVFILHVLWWRLTGAGKRKA